MTFESTIEDVNEVTKRVKVSISADLVKEEFEAAISDLVKNVKLKGFRKGAAPRKMVEQLHGSRVQFEVANKLISRTLDDIIKEKKLAMVGNPDIDISAFEPGKKLEYTAEISLFPSPSIAAYEKFSIEVPKVNVADKDVDDVIERFRKQRATIRPLAGRDTAETGDVVEAEVVVQGSEGKPEPLYSALGDGGLPNEIESGLVGQKIGETRSITVKAKPEEGEQAADVVYDITLKGLKERILPDLDDAFAKSADMQAETLLELRLKVREKLQEEVERESKTNVQVKILDALLEKNAFMVPQSIIDDEIRTMLTRNGLVDPRKMGGESFPVDKFREHLGEAAVRRVRTAIIVDRIAEQEKLAAGDEDLKKSFAEIAERNAVSEDEVKKYFADQRRILGHLLEITRNKVLDFLEARASVKYTEAQKD